MDVVGDTVRIQVDLNPNSPGHVPPDRLIEDFVSWLARPHTPGDSFEVRAVEYRNNGLVFGRRELWDYDE